MRSAFLQTLTALDSDRGRFAAALFVAGAAILVGWVSWGVWGELPIQVFSQRARFESSDGVQVVRAAAAGLVVESRLTPSSHWNPGDTLVLLDDSPDREAWAAARTRLAALQRRHAAIRRQCQALLASATFARSVAVSDSTASRARGNEAEVMARSAERDAGRSASLLREGLVATAAHEHAMLEAERLRAAAQAALAGHARGIAEQLRARALAEDALAGAQADLAELEGELAQAQALGAGARAHLSHRAILASCRCQPVRVAALHTGSYVSQGDTLAWLSTDGPPSAHADFAPTDAIGRIAIGQSATIRAAHLARSGDRSWPARVRHLAPEPQNGSVRVELSLEASHRASREFPYGLPLIVEVTVGTGSPLELLLLGARQRSRRGGAGPSTR
ncbi:MAG: hypothetical protein HOP12_01660 [Candidatus Eisenbacteria bacterium]|uniref:HlyD family efflux transporter periplasmic adaptor subunit n=1 Tax=Eiseniibacteriota bacterium TaxID=2212470 RepID=A0A849SLT3_UNCEI|nr:hypothetical protein [Candidatus Eisenbacteria bacterium]